MKSQFIDVLQVRGHAAAMTNDDNKALVQRALSAFMAARSAEALAPFLSEGFIHHRPDEPTRNRREWLAAVEAAQVPLAGMEVTVQHLLADGDHVVMCSRRRIPAGAEIVVVDTWRIEGGKIAEAWEVIEPVPDAARNFRWWERAQP